MRNIYWDKYDNPKQRVTIKTAIGAERKTTRKRFYSSLGDFSWLQERLIVIGRSWHMIVISVLYTLSFLFTLASLAFAQELEIPLLYILIQVIISLAISVSLVSITLGSLLAHKDTIVFGLSMMKLIQTIGFVLIIIAVGLISILMIFQLFVAFATSIIIAIALSFILYFVITFYKTIIDFTNSCYTVVSTLPNHKCVKPSAKKLRKYLQVLFYISLIQIFVSIIIVIYSMGLTTVVDIAPFFLLVYPVVYSLVLLYAIYLCSYFDRNLDYELYKKKKDEYDRNN